MTSAIQYIVGTSGYSFADWVGTFYPAGTRQNEMLRLYVQRFQTVELNFTFYRMPSAATLERIAGSFMEVSRSPLVLKYLLS